MYDYIISSRNCRSISKRSILTSLVVGFTLRNLVLYDIDEAQISSVYYSLLCDTGDLVNFQKKVCTAHSKKNESCVTQANTVYWVKAKFILARIGNWIILTRCTAWTCMWLLAASSLFLWKRLKINYIKYQHGDLSATKSSTIRRWIWTYE